jgi:hypothetical protein
MNLVFRIRKKYFDDIVSGKKTIEFRKDSLFWQKRIHTIVESCGVKLSETNIVFPEPSPIIGVFICGKRIHRRTVEQIVRMSTPSFSEQGKKDVNTPFCFAFHLGQPIP